MAGNALHTNCKSTRVPVDPCAAGAMCCDLLVRCRVLCDAAILDAGEMKWSAVEPTPFSRCAHSGVLMARQSSPATGEACADCRARPAARVTAPCLVLSMSWLCLSRVALVHYWH